MWEYTRWAFFFVVIGMNSILIYMLGVFIDLSFTTDQLFGGLLSPLDQAAQRVLWWVGLVAVEWALLYFLYRKRTFLRI